MSDTHYFLTPTFKREQAKWYAKLAKEGFYDIESGLDSPPLLKPHHRPLNAVQAASGRPWQVAEDSAAGSEWEELLSTQDRNVLTRETGRGRYMHAALLIAAQEYALRRLGRFRKASEIRASWCLHAQGVSERDIAGYLGVYRHDIEGYVATFKQVIFEAVDIDADT